MHKGDSLESFITNPFHVGFFLTSVISCTNTDSLVWLPKMLSNTSVSGLQSHCKFLAYFIKFRELWSLFYYKDGFLNVRKHVAITRLYKWSYNLFTKKKKKRKHQHYLQENTAYYVYLSLSFADSTHRQYSWASSWCTAIGHGFNFL